VGVEVRDPNGRLWTVRRRIGWPHLRWIGDASDFLLAADFSGGLVVFLALAALVIATLLLLPVLIFIIEAALVVAGIALLLRPWQVVAETTGPPTFKRVWRVRGWRSSRRAVDEVAHELSLGLVPEPEDAEPGSGSSETG
jgi:hypothetical protein